jgi:hypothetical protein
VQTGSIGGTNSVGGNESRWRELANYGVHSQQWCFLLVKLVSDCDDFNGNFLQDEFVSRSDPNEVSQNSSVKMSEWLYACILL